jgi:hypothetical protein
MSDFTPLPINLFLTDLREIETGKLCVAVAEGRAEGPAEFHSELEMAVTEIVITPTSRTFTFVWDNYVAYSVRDESFVQPDDDNPGGSFVERTSSSYLRFIRETSIATDVLQKSLNHVIDVVSTVAPSLGESKPG